MTFEINGKSYRIATSDLTTPLYLLNIVEHANPGETP
jgi:hypothetical protein